MPPTPGTRLGPYEILSALGWRAAWVKSAKPVTHASIVSLQSEFCLRLSRQVTVADRSDATHLSKPLTI
jgi:hypothetical protein